MADTEQQTLKLDLDARQFIDEAHVAQKAIGALGDGASFKGLIDGLLLASKNLATLSVIVLSLKAALDFTVEAESINKINKQFEILAENAGLSGEALRVGLLDAVKGLADDTDVIEAASRAIVSMGYAAKQLPEIMELARKVTQVFGGELVDRFEQISQAVATGNTRILRNIGLSFDLNKAYRAHAAALGTVVEALSEEELRQARVNAVLDKSRVSLAGVSGDLTTATSSIKLITVSLKNMGEIALLAWDRTLGPVVRSYMKGIAEIIGDLKTRMQATFGTGVEQAAAKIDVLSARSFSLKERLMELEDQLKKTDKATQPEFFKYYQREIEITRAKIAETTAELSKYSAMVEQAKGKGEPASKPVDTEKLELRRAQESKFNNDLIALRMQRNKAELEAVTSEKEAERLRAEEIELIQEQTAAKLIEIDVLVNQSKKINAAQAEEMRVQIAAEAEARITAIRQESADNQIRDLERIARAQSNTSEGFAAGMKAAVASGTRDLGNWSKFGEFVMKRYQAHASQAFMAIGEGSKDAGEAMKGFLFGALADIAQAQGEMMILDIYNPAAIAAGAALLVLAGFLRSQAKTPSTGFGGAGGVGAGGYGGAAGTPLDRPELQEQKPKREVTIQIMGHYLDTEGSRRALMEMIRQETDATDFKYVQIGQGA